MHPLASWGFDDATCRLFESHARPPEVPARVVAAHRSRYRIQCPDAERWAEPSGRLRNGSADWPAVGDWAAVRAGSGDGPAVIRAVLPRRTALSRRPPDGSPGIQVLAANVDFVLVMSSCNLDFSPRRLERFCALVYEGGAEPILVLSKSDLCGDATPFVEEARAVAPRAPLHLLSATTGAGCDALATRLQAGKTFALLGASGVGKSTLLNRLAGEAWLATASVRPEDDRGRHTTTHRELVRLPGGALLLDSPGVREAGVADAEEGVRHVFAEVETLASRCRFSDCRHEREPGCAVRRALDPARLEAYEKLKREIAFDERKGSKALRSEHKANVRRILKARRRDARRDRDG